MYYFHFLSLVVSCVVLYVVADEIKELQHVLDQIHRNIISENDKAKYKPEVYTNIYNTIKEINKIMKESTKRRALVSKSLI